MGGTYYRVKPDGAGWRCPDCDEVKPAERVILFTPVGESQHQPSIICLDCVDEAWYAQATCLGTK